MTSPAASPNQTETSRRADVRATVTDKAQGKSVLLSKLDKVVVRSTGRAKLDGKAAILASLKSLRAWAKEAPFAEPTTAAERKALKDRGILTRPQYVALIGKAEKLTKEAKSLVELKPHRQPIGQALYYGARVITELGFAGMTRPTGPDTFTSGPPFAGTFSSRVGSA